MTQKIKLGRDPEQHELLTEAAAALHVGRLGQITLTVDADNKIVGLHAHDAATRGGAFMPLVPINSVAGMAPVMRAIPPLSVMGATAGSTVAFFHELGYQPAVSVLDAAGQQVLVTVTHYDDENVGVTFASAGDYTVYLR